jgi:hypothetical protein
MKIEHLEERVTDYKTSIEKVVEKKDYWQKTIKGLIHKTLHAIILKYKIGWKVQELSWINLNEAINITFDSFPPELMDCTNQIPAFQFISGGSLVFSETYNGDVYVFIIFPYKELKSEENEIIEIGTFDPHLITEKFIVEKVDEFLKEMIQWEVPNQRKKVGFTQLP